MESNYRDEEKYYAAKKKVEKIKGFYVNLVSFIVINIFLIILNLYTSRDYLWFYWPLMWWGLGVVFHGMKVFEVFPYFGKSWEERKINEILEKEKTKSDKWQ